MVAKLTENVISSLTDEEADHFSYNNYYQNIS